VTGWRRTPGIHAHFTPTSRSWLNLVEVWFGIIERQVIRRGVFPSVRDLTSKIRAFITGWNRRKHPFIWTKTPGPNPGQHQTLTNSVSEPLGTTG
jgi:hypothetical protein